MADLGVTFMDDWVFLVNRVGSFLFGENFNFRQIDLSSILLKFPTELNPSENYDFCQKNYPSINFVGISKFSNKI